MNRGIDTISPSLRQGAMGSSESPGDSPEKPVGSRDDYQNEFGSSFLDRRYSMSQLRYERLQKYNQDTIDEINRVPKLLHEFERKVERANHNKEVYLKKKYSKSNDRISVKF